jgi:hypothetical protein
MNWRAMVSISRIDRIGKDLVCVFDSSFGDFPCNITAVDADYSGADVMVSANSAIQGV